MGKWLGREGTQHILGLIRTLETKLQTPRKINIAGEHVGSATFDGSEDITINTYAAYSKATVCNKNNYPWHRFAKTGPITSMQDREIIFMVSRPYRGAGWGLLRVLIRTEASADGTATAQWIIRNGLEADCVKLGFYNIKGNVYADLFYKSDGGYRGALFRVLETGTRTASILQWDLINSLEVDNTTVDNPLTSYESYVSIEKASEVLHPETGYTSTITPTDYGRVAYANSSDTIKTVQLASNADLDTLKDTNITLYYAANGNTINNNPEAKQGFLLRVYRVSGANICQELVSQTGKMYIRYFFNSAWSAFKRVAYTTDNVASATKLQTARKINGVDFDGSADITTSCGKYSKVLNNRVKGAGWYRIACKTSSPQYVGSLTLVRRWSSDTPEAYTILISQMGPSYNFAQLLGTGTQSIKKIRILRATSNPYNSPMYFDIYIDNATNNNPVSAQFNNLQGARFDVDDYMLPDLNTLMTPVEIPEGYTVANEFELANNYGSYFHTSKIDKLTVGTVNAEAPLDIDITGNSGTANKLSAQRYIDGLPFDGTNNLSRLGTCTTASKETIKEVTISGFEDIEDCADAILYIQFTSSLNGTPSSSAGAHAISINGGEALSVYYQDELFDWEIYFSHYPFCQGQIHQFKYHYNSMGSRLELIAVEPRAIANNLTTTDTKIALGAPMGKQLNENYETLKSRVDTINSRLGAIKLVKDFRLSTGTPCEITNLKGAYILVSFQGGAVATIGGIGFLIVSDYTSGGGYHPMVGGDAFKNITAEISSNTVKFNNSTGFDTWCKLYNIY